MLGRRDVRKRKGRRKRKRKKSKLFRLLSLERAEI